MKILFIGDIFGKAGRSVVRRYLSALKAKEAIDLTIANCENTASGRGITERTALQLFDSGIDVLTGGNHLWDKKESFDYLKLDKRIVKPANYPTAYGNDVFVAKLPDGTQVAILNFCGQVFMNAPVSPFISMQDYLDKLEQKIIFVDFHAEASGEKRAFGRYFDGKISAMVGTHTHIQTADEEILAGGTAYITDVGMTGPHDSVIGVKDSCIMHRTLTGMPTRFDAATGGLQLNAVVIDIDNASGRATLIKRIREKYNDENFDC